MSDELIPATTSDDSHKKNKAKPKSKEQTSSAADPERGTSGSRRPRRMPELLDLLAKLEQLPGMVLLGLITPAQANVVQRSVNKLIDVVMHSQTSPSSVVHPAGLIDACRRDPQLIAIIEPLLSDGQLEGADAGVHDDGD